MIDRNTHRSHIQRKIDTPCAKERYTNDKTRMGNKATFPNEIWQTKILKENIINETPKN